MDLACIYNKHEDAQALNVIICHPDEKILIPEFVRLALSTHSLLSQISNNLSGTVQNVLNTKSFEKFIIPIPTLLEQKRIVAKIESIFDRIDAIDKSV